jgi:hypothetical protein
MKSIGYDRAWLLREIELGVDDFKYQESLMHLWDYSSEPYSGKY